LPAQLPKTGAGGGADQWLLLILPLLVLTGGAVFARKKAGR
jgi:LPXTG-motif cell wall-anchored protein